MNLSLVPKFDPPSTGRTTLDMREAKPTDPSIQKPDQETLDLAEAGIALLKYHNELKNRGGE